MNNIPDNPARVAPPESPKGFSIDEAKFDFLENYLGGKFVTLLQKAADINQTPYNI